MSVVIDGKAPPQSYVATTKFILSYQNTLHEIKGFPIARKYNANFVLTKTRLTNELVSNYGYSNGYKHMPNITEHAYVVMEAVLYGSPGCNGLYLFTT